MKYKTLFEIMSENGYNLRKHSIVAFDWLKMIRKHRIVAFDWLKVIRNWLPRGPFGLRKDPRSDPRTDSDCIWCELEVMQIRELTRTASDVNWKLCRLN